MSSYVCEDGEEVVVSNNNSGLAYLTVRLNLAYYEIAGSVLLLEAVQDETA